MYTVALISSDLLLKNTAVLRRLINKNRVVNPGAAGHTLKNQHKVIFVCYKTDCIGPRYSHDQQAFTRLLQYMPALYDNQELKQFKFKLQGLQYAYHLEGQSSLSLNMRVSKKTSASPHDDALLPLVYFCMNAPLQKEQLISRVLDDYKIDRAHLLEVYKPEQTVSVARDSGSIQDAKEDTHLLCSTGASSAPLPSDFRLCNYRYFPEVQTGVRVCNVCNPHAQIVTLSRPYQGGTETGFGAQQSEVVNIDLLRDGHLQNAHIAAQQAGRTYPRHKIPRESPGCCDRCCCIS